MPESSELDRHRDEIMTEARQDLSSLDGELPNNRTSTNAERLDSLEEYQKFVALTETFVLENTCPSLQSGLMEAMVEASESFDSYSYEVRAINLWKGLQGALEIASLTDALPADESLMGALGLPEGMVFVGVSDDRQKGRDLRLYFRSSDEVASYQLSFESNGGPIKLELESASPAIDFVQHRSGPDDTKLRSRRSPMRFTTLADLQDPATFEVSHAAAELGRQTGVMESLGHNLPFQPRSSDPQTQYLIEFREELSATLEAGEITEERFRELVNKLAAMPKGEKDAVEMVYDVVEHAGNATPEWVVALLESTDDPFTIARIFAYARNEEDPLIERAARQKMEPLLAERWPFVFEDPDFSELSLHEKDYLLAAVEKGTLDAQNFGPVLDYYVANFTLASRRVRREGRSLLYDFRYQGANPMQKLQDFVEFSVVNGEYSKDGKITLRSFRLLGHENSPLTRDQRRVLAAKIFAFYDPEGGVYDKHQALETAAYGLAKLGATNAQVERLVQAFTALELDEDTAGSVFRDFDSRMRYSRRELEELTADDIIGYFEQLSELAKIHAALPETWEQDGRRPLSEFLNPSFTSDEMNIDADTMKRLRYRWPKLPDRVATNPYTMAAIMTKFEDVNARELATISALTEPQIDAFAWALQAYQETFATPKEAGEFIDQFTKIESQAHFLVWQSLMAKGKRKDSVKIYDYEIGWRLDDLSLFSGHWENLTQPGHKLSKFENTKDFASLLIRGVRPEMLVKHQDFIFSSNDGYARSLALELIAQNPDTVDEVMDKLSQCTECRSLNRNSKKLLTNYLYATQDLQGVLDLASQLEALENDSSALKHWNDNFLRLWPNANLPSGIAKVRDPNFIAALEPVIQRYKDDWDTNELMQWFIHRYVTVVDFEDPQKLAGRLDDFVQKALAQNYDFKTDPLREKMDALAFDSAMVLAEENADPFHVSFILNVLQGQSIEWEGTTVNLDKTQLQKIAFDYFKNGTSEKLKDKGALLLIGLGTDTKDLSRADIVELAVSVVDRKLTRYEASPHITQQQLDYVNGKNIPLSFYFSVLSNLAEGSENIDIDIFKEKIDTFMGLQDQPIFAGEVLALYHSEGDSSYSNFEGDIFGTEYYQQIAEQNGLDFRSLRHGKGAENKDSMFAYLSNETQDREMTVLVGGHGNNDIISFGRETFNIQELFDSLKARVERTPTDEIRIFFLSCYSENNLKLLYELWEADPVTQSVRTKIVSSSSEGGSTSKMAVDAWRTYAAQTDAGQAQPNWGDFYRHVEARNFILTDSGFSFYGRLNSNLSLWIDGEKLG